MISVSEVVNLLLAWGQWARERPDGALTLPTLNKLMQSDATLDYTYKITNDKALKIDALLSRMYVKNGIVVEVVKMRCVFGYNFYKISQILHCDWHTAKAYFLTAVKKLQEML